jgi:stress response protein SCP2
MTNPITTLLTGANTTLAKEKMLEVTIEWTSSPADLDVSCFMINAKGTVPSDDYFIFYNQPADPYHHVEFKTTGSNTAVFSINLEGLLTTEIEKCVFAATLDGPGTFKGVNGCKVTARTSLADVVYEVKEAGDETSLVFLELYRHQSWLKLRAIGKGFNGGLQPLAEAHGVSVADAEESVEPEVSASGAASSPPALTPTPPPRSAPNPAPAAGSKPDAVFASQSTAASVFQSKSGSDSLFASQPKQASSPMQQQSSGSPSQLGKIDLLKKKVAISLEKKKINTVKARVAIVIDASGSMISLFTKGTVQRAFEKVLAIAACMDDDGALDVWFFASKSMRAPSVTESDYADYVKLTYPKPKIFGKLGIGNNEPVVMADLIKKYTKEQPDDKLPTYVIFFSDGGIYETEGISRLLIESSKTNIFWQFVGLGNADYGVLHTLDNLPGRFIDNANFFALDDLDQVSDEELYDRLFNEFPEWLNQARSKGILSD